MEEKQAGEASRESVWVRAPFASRQDAMTTKRVDLPPAAVDELMRNVRFSMVVMHELRTPLTGLVSSLGMLHDLSQATDDPTKAKLLENAFKSAMLLKRRTDDAQEIVLLRSGAIRLQVTELDAAALVRVVAGEFIDHAADAGVTLQVCPEEGLPRLPGDEYRLQQVLRHFIRNALEFASSGRRVIVRARRRERAIAMEVQDFGPGFDPSERMSMLQPGYRDELQFGEVAGMGIGLELCNLLIEAHGGKILVVTEKGKGSTVAAELPLRVPALDSA
jgi:signal transduction histidine kinase